MTSVLGSVTNWLVGAREPSPEFASEEQRLPSTDNPSCQLTVEDPKNMSNVEGGATTEGVAQETSMKKEVTYMESEPSGGFENDLQEVSEKAIHTAKEWGSYLFSFGKAATEHVAKTAKQLKETVEDKTILGNFSREQEKFVTNNRERKKLSEAAVAPWVGYNEEEVMKTQILALSKDKRNLLRSPPSGVQFHFDYESAYPIAIVMLDEDPNLKNLRFELVPKQIKEELFWRNYFYRVSLIKQSTQLTSLAQQRESTASSSASGKKVVSGSVAEKPLSPSQNEKEGDELAVGSPAVEQEFVSDTYQAGDIVDEELKKEMHQLGVTKNKELLDDGIPEWEKELQAELQEYEVVGDDDNEADDADLELEIMKQIEAESKDI